MFRTASKIYIPYLQNTFGQMQFDALVKYFQNECYFFLQSRQPYMTICQMSTIDGSPKLERQVQKITMQMSNQCPTLKAAGYFNVGRNMILKVCILYYYSVANTIPNYIILSNFVRVEFYLLYDDIM